MPGVEHDEGVLARANVEHASDQPAAGRDNGTSGLDRDACRPRVARQLLSSAAAALAKTAPLGTDSAPPS